MQSSTPPSRPALRVVQGERGAAIEWAWFCGRCALPFPGATPPPPSSRVCRACGFGLLLETPGDCVPDTRDAFLVADSALLVQALSVRAEQLLGIGEGLAVDRPLGALLAPADAEGGEPGNFAAAVAGAVARGQGPVDVFVRPSNVFGVRMRARIAPCGPPRSALIILQPQSGRLRVLGR
jgi:hypothetical protein